MRVVGHSGLVADQKLAKKCLEVLFKELAAVVREQSNCAPREVAMIASKECLEAVLNLCSGCIVQVVDFKVFGRKVVEAQHVAEAKSKWQRN
eukprot:6212518-Pleurochrysis_carterae.AAC.4